MVRTSTFGFFAILVLAIGTTKSFAQPPQQGHFGGNLVQFVDDVQGDTTYLEGQTIKARAFAYVQVFPEGPASDFLIAIKIFDSDGVLMNDEYETLTQVPNDGEYRMFSETCPYPVPGALPS